MHPNQAFRSESREENIAFARSRSFGVLSVNGENGPLISHIPFQLSDDGTSLEAHLVRSNPILRLLDESEKAVVAVSGADAYLSPDWYGADDQVPTWNYVAIHLRGTLRQLPKEALSGVLDRLSDAMESRLLPKAPWKTDKMSNDAYEKMKRQIVPIAMDVTEINGTWKLSQNKPDNVQRNAIDGLKESRIGSELDQIIELMSANLERK